MTTTTVPMKETILSIFSIHNTAGIYLPDIDLFCWQAFDRVPAVPVPDNLHSNGDPKERQQQQEQR